MAKENKDFDKMMQDMTEEEQKVLADLLRKANSEANETKKKNK